MEYESANLMLLDELKTTHFPISHLFVNLSDRDKNSEKWNHQIKFWSRFIRIWSDQTHMIEFSKDRLSKSLIYVNDGIELIPNLKPTIDYLITTGLLKTRDDVISNKSILNTITSAVLGLVFPFGSKEIDSYVIIDSLKKKADDIINEVVHYAIDYADLCLTQKEFESRFRCDEKYSMEVLEKALLKTKLVKKVGNGYFFRSEQFDDFDESAADVIIGTKNTIAEIESKIDILETQVQSYEDKAREYVKQSRKNEARSMIVRRCQLNKQIDRYRQMRNNLESTIASIETSHTTKKVMDSLKTTNETMKNMNLPDQEEVDKVMDDMQYYTHDVIDELSQAMVGSNPVDDDELDQELKNLYAEMQQENQQQQQQHPQQQQQPAYRLPAYY